MTEGSVVISKCGRDKGRRFVVLSMESDFLYLTDGDVRPLERPKKRKIKHVQQTEAKIDLSAVLPMKMTNADIRKFLLPYQIKNNHNRPEEAQEHCQRTTL